MYNCHGLYRTSYITLHLQNLPYIWFNALLANFLCVRANYLSAIFSLSAHVQTSVANSSRAKYRS